MENRYDNRASRESIFQSIRANLASSVSLDAIENELRHEKDTTAANAEVHDASDDVYYVLEGTATLTLGGTLDSPKEVEPGEWRGSKIIGGQKVEIAKGDVVIVPRGTPHHRSTANQDFTMLLIKVWEDPRPAAPPK